MKQPQQHLDIPSKGRWRAVLRFTAFCLALAAVCWVTGSGGFRFGVSVDPKAERWVKVQDFDSELAIHRTVFWEPLDTESLRALIRTTPEFIKGKSVLEIGTGSGLIALCCCQAGAASVTATDINPNAIECAKANARRLGSEIDFRLVPSGDESNDEAGAGPEAGTEAEAETETELTLGKRRDLKDDDLHDASVDTGGFSVIQANERFDLIISNPPWEDATPKQWSDYALYDPNFELLRSILAGCRKHLRPGGKLVLVYGCVEAIRVTQKLASEFDLKVLVLDERDPETLPDVFLPGMMLGLMPSHENTDSPR